MTASAQEMVTDRPDATESSSVVPQGTVQLETGWLYTDSGQDLERHELPGTLVRIGMMDRVELRLGWGGYIDESGGGDQNGIADGELGTKLYMFAEDGGRPETALLASISLPIGDDAFTSDAVDPAFRFSMAHTLNDTFSLGYNLGMEWGTETDEIGRESTLSTFVYTAALGAGLTDTVGTYIEALGDVGLSADGAAHSLDGGFTWLMRKNTQLDMFAGVGLSRDADNWFAGAGISILLP